MSDEETRLKRSRSRKKNYVARVLHDPNEHKGAFRMKVIDGRKEDYKRIRMRVTEYDNEETD